MRKLSGWLVASGITGLLIVVTVAQADDKKISLDKVPKAVMTAVKDRFPGADITSVEKETENGEVIYDFELKHDGRKYEMDIKENGTITEIEKEVVAKDVPEAVTNAVKAKFPGATITEVMEVNKVKGKEETPDHYEVNLTTADNKKMEVEVSLDGKKVKAEKAEKD
jgi:uncharacterized membrane protein YkoI